jgi:hypothetical protein
MSATAIFRQLEMRKEERENGKSANSSRLWCRQSAVGAELRFIDFVNGPIETNRRAVKGVSLDRDLVLARFDLNGTV